MAEPQSSESLAEELSKLLTDEGLTATLGQNARKKAESWDWEIKSKKLEEYFENI